MCNFVVHKIKTSNLLNLMKNKISNTSTESISQKLSIEENIRVKQIYMRLHNIKS